ncbi:hypothetical protein KVR01_001270 [Diaporthe batatas]|uniref:uncharacterized protein n=1 Tax=Diaporthe batatas TaxID=748121 RepID=UPI001D039640|nr:uncharacterized protein KVR01_001270 [Diaporthe batatas]KAG8168521.1 hypothetical protein KVR01_001270 [Diaporthe batatas]
MPRSTCAEAHLATWNLRLGACTRDHVAGLKAFHLALISNSLQRQYGTSRRAERRPNRPDLASPLHLSFPVIRERLLVAHPGDEADVSLLRSSSRRLSHSLVNERTDRPQ